MMSSHASSGRLIKEPGPDHPITISPNPRRVIVKVGGRVVANTHRALILKEANYPAIQYVPRDDVDMSLLVPTEHKTYCPYKGECSYYSIPAGGERSANAVWSYENPHKAVEVIGHYLAFYTDRVDSIEQSDA